MLSAFTARPIVELKPKEKSKIESLLSYGAYHAPQSLIALNLPVSCSTPSFYQPIHPFVPHTSNT